MKGGKTMRRSLSLMMDNSKMDCPESLQVAMAQIGIELIECPRQPGKVKITKRACTEGTFWLTEPNTRRLMVILGWQSSGAWPSARAARKGTGMLKCFHKPHWHPGADLHDSFRFVCALQVAEKGPASKHLFVARRNSYGD
jgi:hypothetical protein